MKKIVFSFFLLLAPASANAACCQVASQTCTVVSQANCTGTFYQNHLCKDGILCVPMTEEQSKIASDLRYAAGGCSVVGPQWMKNIGIECGTLIPDVCIDSEINTVCGLNEMLQTVINVSQLIFAFTGSAALLMFTYGGIMFIIAAGSQERVQKARQALSAAVIGIAIILGSWLIINFTIIALTGCEINSKAKLFAPGCGSGGNDPFQVSPTR